MAKGQIELRSARERDRETNREKSLDRREEEEEEEAKRRAPSRPSKKKRAKKRPLTSTKMSSSSNRNNSRYRRERLATIVLMGAAAVTEKMDEGVLPSVFLAVGASLGVGPAELGTVALCRALAQAASSPLAGALGDSLDRTRVVSAGCLLWALATFLLAAATSLRQMLALAAFNGLGLALALPALQSVVADAVPARSRGSAFGGVGLAAGFGGMLAAFSATAAARHRFFASGGSGSGSGGVEGWRVAFAAVALISAVVGALSWFLAVDPRDMRDGNGAAAAGAGAATGSGRRGMTTMARRGGGRRGRQKQEKLSDPGEVLSDGDGLLLPSSSTSTSTTTPTTPTPPPLPFSQLLRGYLFDTYSALRVCFRVPSFRVVVGQGVLGSMPWNAMAFCTLWLQLLGFSDVAAGALAALFAASCACGSLLGGFVGDAAAKRTAKRPNSSVGGVGRVAVAQFSVAASIPLAVILLRFLPSSGPCRCQENIGGVVVTGHFFHTWGAATSANASCSPRSARCSAAFALVVALMGLFSSWCGANNSAVFAEIVPADLRSSVYAFDRGFEGAVGALATPLVGVVASRVFGFEGSLAGGGGGGHSSSSSSGSDSSASSAPSALNLPQARALASALVLCSVVPWALCFCTYSLLFRYYPTDAAAASAAAASAAASSSPATAGAASTTTAAGAPPPSSSLELVEGSSFGGGGGGGGRRAEKESFL